MAWTYERELAAALAAVRAASGVCRSVQEKLISADTLTKKDKSPVTVADFASQAIVCRVIAAMFPGDAIVGEEGTGELRQDAQAEIRKAVVERLCEHCQPTSGPVTEREAMEWIDLGGRGTAREERFWTLDPIDGTKGFLRKEQYAIALALIENGRVVLGVLGCPNLTLGESRGAMLMAVRGLGTRLQSVWSDQSDLRLVRVDDVATPAGARFCESVESGHSDQDASAQIARSLGITAQPLRMDSQAKYATVAAGEASIYLRLPTRADYREKIWDHAAGAIAVEEAGGRVTDVDGRPLDFSRGRELTANRGIVATSGAIHDAVVESVRAAVKGG